MNTTQKQSGNELSMAEAKALANKSLSEAAGQRFIAQTGAIGVILAEPSVRGKPQAELSCLESGCTETHIREISDWHQCGKCRTHKKTKTRSGGGSSTVSVSGIKLMKILPTDDAEMVALKEQNNAVVEQVLAKEKEDREAKKAADAEARKAKQVEEQAKKQLEKAEATKRALRENMERIQKVAAEKGLPVSPKTLQAVSE